MVISKYEYFMAPPKDENNVKSLLIDSIKLLGAGVYFHSREIIDLTFERKRYETGTNKSSEQKSLFP
jgi:hypothetical protein